MTYREEECVSELDEARKMLLIPRAEWCADELDRSARAFVDEPGLEGAAEGTAFMAQTIRELRAETGRASRLAERLAMTSRFLCDMLQMSNEKLDSMYGKHDDLERALVELRLAIREWETTR